MVRAVARTPGRRRWLRALAIVLVAVVVVSGVAMMVERGSTADVVAPPEPEDLPRPLTLAEVARDVEVLVETIEAVHIAPYRHIPKAELCA